MLFQAVQKFLKQKREPKYKNSESGATLTEYSLVVSLVVMVAMYPMWKMGDETARVLCDAADMETKFNSYKSGGFGAPGECNNNDGLNSIPTPGLFPPPPPGLIPPPRLGGRGGRGP